MDDDRESIVDTDYYTGFTIHDTIDDIVQHERACLDPTPLEDAAREHERYTRRRRTMSSCTLPCEHNLPRANATSEQLTAYQQQHGAHLVGGFNPLALVRGSSSGQ